MSTTPETNGLAASINKPTRKNKFTVEHKFPAKLIYDSPKLETTLDKIYGDDGWDLILKDEHVVITVNAETPIHLKEKLQIEGVIEPDEGMNLWVALVHGAFSKM
ncbi:hypothetical protein NW762_014791 [Fusarium torreyae]|uniref:Uncharacterized protein n=1 Tax=Fusarium torreyae TaxID=1237075 RepID=A0A9W8RKY8_9HYPO|nr:hypothetical protein NW762_014791 [Fusarium torreyae]